MLLIDGKQYKGVLWDMDGLLVDSETLSKKVVRILDDELLHIQLSEDEIAGKIGMVDKEYYNNIIKKYNLNVSLDELMNKCDITYNALLSTVEIFPGAIEIPQMLKSKGMKMAIVSGSTKQQIDMVLKILGLKDVMDVIVSCEDYSQGKPDPEGYLLGAERLGISPSECIGFEDSTRGIKALNNIGSYSIGVKNKCEQDISEASMQINSLLEFSKLLETN